MYFITAILKCISILCKIHYAKLLSKLFYETLSVRMWVKLFLLEITHIS